jgi:chromosome segregation ATPase
LYIIKYEEEDEEIKRIIKEKDEKIKRKDEEIERLKEEKDEEIKRKEEEINKKNSELKNHLAGMDEKLKKEIYRISKTAWHDFVGEDFEIENGVLGLERDVYLSIVKFLDSHTLKKV